MSGPLTERVHSGLGEDVLGVERPADEPGHAYAFDGVLTPWCRRLASVVTFYLSCGILPWSLAQLLEMTAAAAGCRDAAPGQAGGVRRLVSKYANWTLWLGITMLRKALDDTRSNWAVAFTTRHCPQLGGSATEILISVIDEAGDAG